MARIALALALDSEDRVADELVRHGHELVARAASADELASILVATGTEYVVVAASSRYLTLRLVVEADAAGVRIVALVASDSDRRHALEIGLHETVPADADWAEIETMLFGGVPVDPAAESAAGAATAGSVIAVWGPAGAPGRTTLAINIAAELAAMGHTVALADIDTYSGSIAPALGLLDEAPGFAAACRLAGTGSLDLGELERIGQRYLSARGGFWVLTGIGRPSRWPELSADRVASTIAQCRKWVEYTVIDTGFSLENDEEISSDLFAPRRNAATLSALEHADHIVAVGSADPVGLARFLRAHVDLLETLSIEKLTVVMNKIRPSAIGLDAAGQVKQTLQRFGGIASPVLIPHDQPALDAAILSGKTLFDCAVKSPTRIAIGQFVRERIAPTPEVEGRKRRSRRAQRAAVGGGIRPLAAP